MPNVEVIDDIDEDEVEIPDEVNKTPAETELAQQHKNLSSYVMNTAGNDARNSSQFLEQYAKYGADMSPA